MKKTKSFKLLLIIITAIAALFACVFIFAPKAKRASAEGTAQISIEGSKQLSLNDKSPIVLTVKMKNTSGIALYAVDFHIQFDTEVFEVANAEAGSDMPGDVNFIAGSYNRIIGSVNVPGTVECDKTEFVLATITLNLKKTPEAKTYAFNVMEEEYIVACLTTSDGTVPSSVDNTFGITFSAPSTDSSLTALTVDGKAITLTAGQTSYTASDVAYGTTKVRVNATAAAGATVKVNGGNNNTDVNLNEGANTITIEVTSQAGGTNKTTYTVAVNRAAGDTDASLKATPVVTLNGTALTVTASGNNYTVTEPIAYADRKGVTISADKNSAKAKSITIDGTATTSKAFTNGIKQDVAIVVTPEKGAAVTYHVLFTLTPASTNNNLSSLVVKANGTALTLSPEFNAEHTEYILSLPEGVTTLVVEAEKSDSKATVTGTGEQNIANASSITVEVTAESGAKKTYRVTFNTLSADTSLKTLTVNGTPVVSATTNYATTVPFATTTAQVEITLSDDSATITTSDVTKQGNVYKFTLANLKVGANEKTFTVKSQSGVEVDYKLTVTRGQGDNNAAIKGTPALTPEGSSTALEIQTSEDGKTFTVVGDVDYALHDKITVEIAAQSDKVSEITIDGTPATVTAGVASQLLTLAGDTNEIPVTITAEDGTTVNEYTIVINVAKASADTSLVSDPKVFNGETELRLTSIIDGKTYLVRYAASITELSVIAIANDSTATVEVRALPETSDKPISVCASGEDITLTSETTRLAVVVTAQSGESRTYEILLSPYGGSGSGETPAEEQKFITVEINGQKVEIHRDELKSQLKINKSNQTLTFTITAVEGVSVDVVYGGEEESGEVSAKGTLLVAYAEEATEEGVVKSYKLELGEGSNPILLKVNDTGIPGADEYYSLNVISPAKGSVAWIVLFAVFLFLFILMVVAIILLMRYNSNDDNPNGDGTVVLAEAAPAPEYTVKFEMNGHGKQVKKQKTVNGIITEPEAPVAEGFIFGGWYKDEECTEKFGFEDAVEQDLKIYAQWTEEPKPEPEPVAEEAVAEEQVVEEAPAEEEQPAQEEAPAEEEQPAEEAVAEEQPAQEEAPAEEEQPAEEAVAEEQPVEEEAPAEEPAEVQPAEESEEKPAEEDDGESIQIKHVQTHREKYESLSHEQRVFYDELKLRAMATPGAVLNENKSNETIRVGQKRIMKLTIRREYVVACFFAENQSVTNLKRAMRGKNIRINTRETEIPIYDMRAFEAAEEMLQIVLDGLFDR